MNAIRLDANAPLTIQGPDGFFEGFFAHFKFVLNEFWGAFIIHRQKAITRG